MKLSLGVIVSLFFLTGCSLRYLAHVSTGQLAIMHKRVNIKDTLSEREVKGNDAAKLKFSLDVREYAVHHLKLSSPGSKSYTKWVKLDRSSVVYNIVACPKDFLTPLSWSYPIVGAMSYRGFFDLDYAKTYQKEYEQQGYDVYLRGASAYSTLGWFADPIYSPMLKYRFDSLANVIIHELTHETVYLKGQTDLNEGIATFIGNKGSLMFLKEKYGDTSIHYKNALAAQQDEILFSTFIQETKASLKKYYAQAISKEAKIKGRQKEFDKIMRQFSQLKPQLKISYRYFDQLKLNNAILAGFGQYIENLDLYEKVWLKHNRNLIETIQFFKTLDAHKQPIQYLKQWVQS